ncbi:MAG: hypothetical protein II954_01140 [Synergistaceae bacterium]|nr:hypothetical protein [Synergistaceae bacterium]
MNDECVICGAGLEYSERAELMECSLCRRKVYSRAKCVNGHYVCDECHSDGAGGIVSVCMKSGSRNPAEILDAMMSLPFCHMHGPEHHIMVGAALLTAYRNAGGEIELECALSEMLRRGREVPGGACGFWGACGAGISAGIFVSIVSGSTPLSVEPFRLSHMMTSRALAEIGGIGGPRCCKRDSYLSLLAGVDFVRENFGVEMVKPEITCKFFHQNNQCIGLRCPFRKP